MGSHWRRKSGQEVVLMASLEQPHILYSDCHVYLCHQWMKLLQIFFLPLQLLSHLLQIKSVQITEPHIRNFNCILSAILCTREDLVIQKVKLWHVKHRINYVLLNSGLLALNNQQNWGIFRHQFERPFSWVTGAANLVRQVLKGARLSFAVCYFVIQQLQVNFFIALNIKAINIVRIIPVLSFALLRFQLAFYAVQF